MVQARYQAVSKFLEDTESYIHNLAGKVASVKLGQEASEAAAVAVLEARATGASEEEVKAAAASAAADAAASSDLISRSRHHVGDAQSRYYRCSYCYTDARGLVRLQSSAQCGQGGE